jgi:putative peptidoglycan lipid II flippase
VLVALLYKSGKFGDDDVRWVWGILAASSVGLLAGTLGRLYSSAFYALRDTRTPLRFAIARVSIGTALSATFAFGAPRVIGLGDHWGAAGITLGSALAAWLEFTLLRRALARRIGAAGVEPSVLARFVIAAAVAGAAGFGAKTALAGQHHFIVAAVAVPSFGAAYFTIGAALGLPEPRTFVMGFVRRIRR